MPSREGRRPGSLAGASFSFTSTNPVADFQHCFQGADFWGAVYVVAVVAVVAVVVVVVVGLLLWEPLGTGLAVFDGIIWRWG